MFRHLHDVSLITEHHMIICTHPPTSFFVDLSIYTISFCSLLFSFDAFHVSDDQRTCWLLTESNFGENKMFQPYWTNVVLPLLRLLQQEVCASLTGTRTLPFFSKRKRPLEEQRRQALWALTGENSVGKYVGNFHRCERLSPCRSQKWGWKMSVRYSFVPSPPKNDVWFHLRESELKSNFALHKSPWCLWIWVHLMLSWCLDRRDTDQAAEYGSSIKKKKRKKSASEWS